MVGKYGCYLIAVPPLPSMDTSHALVEQHRGNTPDAGFSRVGWVQALALVSDERRKGYFRNVAPDVWAVSSA